MFLNRKLKTKNNFKIFFPKYIFLISEMINSQFIKYVVKSMFQKYFGKNNPEVIVKRDKMVVLENDGGTGSHLLGCRRNSPN